MSQGYTVSLSEIKKTLTSSGWSEDKIDNAIDFLQGKNMPVAPSTDRPRYNQNNVNPQIQKGEIPIGAKIISVIYYISFGITILGLIGLIIIGIFFRDMLMLLPFGAGLLTFVGIIGLGFAVLYFFIGRGLWKGQNWARIVVIIFSILGLLSGIIALIGKAYFQGIFALAIPGVIGSYLLFSKKIKAAFVKI